jgi:hypothetical protein
MLYPEYVPPLDPQEAGLTMRTIGWTLLVVDVMVIALFAPADLGVGHFLWPTWMVLQGIAGLAFVAAGVRKEEQATVIEGRVIALPKRTEVRSHERKVA